MQLFKNNASSLLVANITNVALSLQVTAGEGALFPAPTGGDYFLLTLSKIYSGIETIVEIVKVTARVGDVFTIVRAQEGTTNNAYVMGDHVALRSTAASFTAYETLLASLNSGPLAGFRNRIINGGFDVWQRGTSGFSNFTYSADRWSTDAGTSVSRSTDVPPGFAYSAKHTGVTSSYAAHRTGIELPGTGVQGEYYDGATFTFSCLCKTSVAGKTLTLYSAFTTAVGVAGSRTVSDIAIGTTSTSWTKYTYTFTIPTGASIATAKCLEVTPYVSAPNCDVYITGVQLEPGPVATPFEFRPYSVELALCQRYYLRIKHEQRVYAPTISSNGIVITHPTMRVTPTWSTLIVGTLTNASSAVATAYSNSQLLLTLNSSAAGDSYSTGRVYESTGTEL